MNVLYDNQIFTWQRFGGISRYFVELIKNLDDDVRYELPLIFSDNQYLQTDHITSYRRFLIRKEFKGKGRIVAAANQFAFNRALCRGKQIDIVHPTYYDPKSVALIGSKPFVLTVYDMTHEMYPSLFASADLTAVNKKILCEKAAKIIAISHNTKRDLVKIYGVDPSKIEVIYLGQSFERNTDCTMELPARFVLFTGQRDGYKNFERFARAFARLEDVDLICTGKSFDAAEAQLLQELGIANRVRSIFATDKQLAELYARASLFVFPSLYEGFGIPILEAFAAQCPIALSDRSSFPEIARDAGAYFDPTDVESIYQTMDTVLSNERLQNEMVAKGQVELEKFSWKKMAEQTCQVYKSLIK